MCDAVSTARIPCPVLAAKASPSLDSVEVLLSSRHLSYFWAKEAWFEDIQFDSAWNPALVAVVDSCEMLPFRTTAMNSVCSTLSLARSLALVLLIVQGLIMALTWVSSGSGHSTTGRYLYCMMNTAQVAGRTPSAQLMHNNGVLSREYYQNRYRSFNPWLLPTRYCTPVSWVYEVLLCLQSASESTTKIVQILRIWWNLASLWAHP